MRFTILIAIMASFIVGCSSFDVHSDFDPKTDFLLYRTFAVKKDAKIPGDVLAENKFAQERIFASIESALIERGLRQVAPDKAELLVLTYAGVEERVNLSTYGYSASPYWGGYGYGGYGYGGYGGGYTSTQTVVHHYKQGTLHIDILDTEKKSLVWKGSGTGVVGESRSPQESQEVITEVVTEILDNFPPH